MDKKIQNLGQLKGKILLFGGVYSNLQALEATIQFAQEQGIPPENCLCTGDIIGYCAQPLETIETFKAWGAKAILGNVEVQLITNQDDCGCDFVEGSRCDLLSNTWYPFAKKQLDRKALNWLQTLPDHLVFSYQNHHFGMVHGSYKKRSQFIFNSTPWQEKSPNFKALSTDVIIAGHCGLPFTNSHDNQTWINPGVIGMPANDGTPKVWCAVLTPIAGGFQYSFTALHYDHITASKYMQDVKLPESYAETLNTGIWDTMDILPASERRLQGLALSIPDGELIKKTYF